MEVGKKKILNGFIGGNNSTQFAIPIYQRNYVWEKKNVLQLLEDIEKMIPYYDNDDESIFHFFGSIVYIDTLHKGSFSEWTIIDGQQRLTTIFLILQVLKQIYYEQEKIITKKYLLNDEDIINTSDEMDRYRLKPLVSDDNVYKLISDNKLERLNDSEQNSNVLKAYNVIKKELEKWKSKYAFEEIMGAIDKFKVVWIQLDKKEDPQQVFESINSTGVNLSAADLIRNFVLMNKDNATQTRIYNEYWSPIEFDYVGTKNLKEFFRFYVSIKEKITIPEREVYEKFKIQYEKLLAEQNEEKILSEILNYAKYYYYISRDASESNNQTLEEILKDYRNAKSNMPHIVIMETMNLYFNKQRIEESDLLNTIKLLTNYIVRRNICGIDTKSISNIFGSMLGKILRKFEEGENYYYSVLKTFVIDTRLTNQFMPTDKTVEEEFNKSNLYSRESTTFVLKKIENNESRIPYSNLNVEHVMPQTETKYWSKYINENSIYEEVVNRIGNLTLVDSKDNSSMSNRNFDAKKQVLNKSRHIKMNEDILNKECWNEDEILERSKNLSQEFIKIFPYPDVVIDETDDIYMHINLNDDSINDYKDYVFSNPLEITIDDNSIDFGGNWSDALARVLIELYSYDTESFIKASKEIADEYGYKGIQIANTPIGMRTPYEFIDGMFVENNTNTIHKLSLMQRMIRKMNYEPRIVITYITKNTEI